jgi:hypothetical protein
MRVASVLALALLPFLGACGSFTPVAVKAGDICQSCGKTITEVRLAAEGTTAEGSVLKFGSPECLAQYMHDHPNVIAAKWVTDYPSGRFVRPEIATYVRATTDENTREVHYVAFAVVTEAVDFGREHLSSPVDWLSVQRMTGEKRSD